MNDMVKELNQIGQSIWYDNIERKLLDDGTLDGMVKRGEIRGITSNPSIFNKAISQSMDYDQEIKSLLKENLSRKEVYGAHRQISAQEGKLARDILFGIYRVNNKSEIIHQSLH